MQSLKRARSDDNILPYLSNKRSKRAQLAFPGPVPMQMVRRNNSFYSGTGPTRRGATGRRRYRDPFTMALNSRMNSRYPKPEVKFLDNNQNNLQISDVGLVLNLNTMAQGGTSGQRIGVQISTKSCAYRINLSLGATPAPCSGRVMLIWDRQSNGALPAIVDVLATATLTSYMNLFNAQRFVIIRNDQFSLSPNGQQTVLFEGFANINQKSTYSNIVNTPQSGNLFALLISDTTVVASQPVMDATWRLRFIDC